MGCGRSSGSGVNALRSKIFDMEFHKELKKKDTAKDRSKKMKKKTHHKKEDRLKIDKQYSGLFEAIDMNDGDESSAIQAWQGSIFEPSVHEPKSKEKAQVTYKIDYIYGAKMDECRENIHINSSGQIVYTAAGVGIILNAETKEQVLFGGGEIDLDDPKSARNHECHTDEILCGELNEERTLVATGQIGNKPYVFLWDAKTGEMKSRIKMNTGVNGICSICFSPDGDKIACLDITDEQSVWIYEIKHQKLLKVIKTDSNKKFDIDWGIKSTGEHIIGVAGVENALFIQSTANSFKDADIEFGVTNRQNISDHVCIGFDEEGIAYTGTKSGFLFKWFEVKNMFQVVLNKRVHTKAVHAIKYSNKYIFSGGGDFTIKISAINFKVLCILETASTVRSVDFFKGLLIFGTANGKIYKYNLDLETKKFTNPDTLLVSHFAKQECGIYVINGSLYTCGDDNQLIQRNYIEKDTPEIFKLYDDGPKSKELAQQVNAGNKFAIATEKLLVEDEEADDFECDVSINEKLDHLAVSFKKGQVLIKSLSSPAKLLFTLGNSEQSCESIEYSPNNTYLAIGSHDHNIYVYECALEKYTLLRTYTWHTGGIVGIDWGIESKFFRSNGDKNDLVFWNVAEKKYVDAEAVKDVQWSSQNCLLAWNSQGVIPYGASPDLVNGCAREDNLKILATGDDNGKVNIYRDPGLPEFNKVRTFRGHVGHVGRVAFSEDGNYMFSVGGYDRTIIQWKKVDI